MRPKAILMLNLGHLGRPRVPQERPRAAQERPQSGLRAAKSAPRAAQERPKSGQERPKSAQEHPKSAPSAAKSAPRAAQERPRAAQERPRAALPGRHLTFSSYSTGPRTFSMILRESCFNKKNMFLKSAASAVRPLQYQKIFVKFQQNFQISWKL